MLVPPGLPPPLGLPSHGSRLHSVGGCKPCMWFWKPSGCTRGEECLHCHMCPLGTRPKRSWTRGKTTKADCAAIVELTPTVEVDGAMGMTRSKSHPSSSSADQVCISVGRLDSGSFAEVEHADVHHQVRVNASVSATQEEASISAQMFGSNDSDTLPSFPSDVDSMVILAEAVADLDSTSRHFLSSLQPRC